MFGRIGPVVVTVAALFCVFAASGCSEGRQPSATGTASPFQPVLDDKDFMNWVLDPVTDVIWGSAGTIFTLDGEEDLAPVDDEGWARVRNAAAVVAESGNLLMLPGRSKGPDWDEFARGIVTMGQRAMAAAEAQDDEALFEVGGQLYNVCVACHQIYMLPESD
ncbi:MAG: hypothetical protein RIC56_02260 [Pseudomonadales bacterium]